MLTLCSVNENPMNENHLNENHVNKNQMNWNQTNENQLDGNQMSENQMDGNQMNENQVNGNQTNVKPFYDELNNGKIIDIESIEDESEGIKINKNNDNLLGVNESHHFDEIKCESNDIECVPIPVPTHNNQLTAEEAEMD